MGTYMSIREAQRLGVVEAAVAGRITNGEGAGALDLTVRQFRRLKRLVRIEGAPGLIHLRRGAKNARKSSNMSSQPEAPRSPVR